MLQQTTPTTPAKQQTAATASQLAIGNRSSNPILLGSENFKANYTAIKSTIKTTRELHRPRMHKTVHFLWGSWIGAQLVKITALETDYIGDTGPYSYTPHNNSVQKLVLSPSY
ncbi:hypothetical protein OUZ56_026282 [Daphnia magna]|uniref:Uncharacterized protein n=1 Tax=Daphnia magna TaxID=35525 RepID=A0ABQ9ZL98_9CRUS|nr:hypothetical protein OUZ56_026282 [Daphnia magna]